jgi:hypothetical protein
MSVFSNIISTLSIVVNSSSSTGQYQQQQPA